MRAFYWLKGRSITLGGLFLLIVAGICVSQLRSARQSLAEDAKSASETATKPSSDSPKPSNQSKPSLSKIMESRTKPKYNELTDKEAYVILNKGTERAGTGVYTDYKKKGTYICRQCNAPLYKSDCKFDSHCGWPSFDDEIEGAVERRDETDGTRRTEIVCKNCGGHLGHVFLNEGFTAKNTRHCVNSISMRFIAEGRELPKTIRLDDGKEDAKEEGKETKTEPEQKKKASGGS
jgi:methionine-R-sulfoxide reductase